MLLTSNSTEDLQKYKPISPAGSLISSQKWKESQTSPKKFQSGPTLNAASKSLQFDSFSFQSAFVSVLPSDLSNDPVRWSSYSNPSLMEEKIEAQ